MIQRGNWHCWVGVCLLVMQGDVRDGSGCRKRYFLPLVPVAQASSYSTTLTCLEGHHTSLCHAASDVLAEAASEQNFFLVSTSWQVFSGVLCTFQSWAPSESRSWLQAVSPWHQHPPSPGLPGFQSPHLHKSAFSLICFK